jgi:hypothetical protein
MWGDLISAQVLAPACSGCSASTLIGNVLYWQFKFAVSNILEFDLDRQRLDVIKKPPAMNGSQRHQIIEAEDGAVGLAIFCTYSIQLWQRKANCQGVPTWSLWKFVDDIVGMPPMIRRKRGWLTKFLGYDEDTNAMFLYVLGSVYMVQLKSLHSKKLHKTSYSNAQHCHPFSSFYTPGNCTSLVFLLCVHDFLNNSLSNVH